MKITIGTMTKKQALKLMGSKEAVARLEATGKEVFTDEEVDALNGFEWFPRYPVVGNNPTSGKAYNSHLAEDDLVDSFDNNFDLWR